MSQTRHYEMKDSGVEWIGEIPIGWKVIRNKALFEEVNERCGASPNLTLLSVSEYYGVAPRAEKIAEDEMLTRAESLEGYKICHKNDIVMNIMLAWKRSQGVSQYDGIVSPAYCVFRRKDDAPIDMRYIHYLIRTDRYADEYKCHSTGIIDSRLRLYPDKFLALESHVPPLPEQTAIAAYLDEKCATIDAIVTEAKATIEEYKAWRASVIFEAVTKGLDPNAEMKDSGVEWIGKMPKAWQYTPLKYLASCNDEVLTETTPEDYTFDYIDIGSVHTGNGIGICERMQFKDAPSRARRIVRDGDIIVSTVRTYLKAIAQVGNYDVPHIASTGFAVIRTKNANASFLRYALLSDNFVSQVEADSVGISYPAINASQIMAFKIPVPSIAEQVAIASYLDARCAAIDGIIAEKEALISDLETYKKSLIFEVVTGKRRVC